MSTSITLVYMVHKVNVFSTRLIVNNLLLGILLCKSSTETCRQWGGLQVLPLCTQCKHNTIVASHGTRSCIQLTQVPDLKELYRMDVAHKLNILCKIQLLNDISKNITGILYSYYLVTRLHSVSTIYHRCTAAGGHKNSFLTTPNLILYVYNSVHVHKMYCM